MASEFQKAMSERPRRDTSPAEPRITRGEVREEDPRARAARRAAELRTHRTDMDDGTDEFYIDPHSVPDGWTYEWKRRTIYNQEDPAYQVQLAREGWEPVPVSKHPSWMPIDWPGNTIERKGMILMERPEEITREIRALEQRRAREQVKIKEQQLSSAPDGTLTRDHAKVAPKIKKSFEAMPIPED